MALNKQVWLKQISENFYPETSFLSKVVDLSGFVENNRIHMALAGIDPKVRINDKTYPIKDTERTDGESEFPLDTFETENTLIRHIEAVELSYNKLESVIKQHRATLQTAVAQKAIHAYAPNTDTTETPVLRTTGEVTNGRKRLRFDDILTLKEAFDGALVPLEKRYIVLHPSHVTDLLREDMQLFKELTEIKNGEPTKFAGFGFFSFPFMPTFYNGEKVAYTAEKTPHFASVAFHGDEVMKSDGDFKMFSNLDDVHERASIIGFEKRFIGMPIRGRGIGAIVSASE